MIGHPKHAQKAIDAGVDILIAQGGEGGNYKILKLYPNSISQVVATLVMYQLVFSSQLSLKPYKVLRVHSQASRYKL